MLLTNKQLCQGLGDGFFATKQPTGKKHRGQLYEDEASVQDLRVPRIGIIEKPMPRSMAEDYTSQTSIKKAIVPIPSIGPIGHQRFRDQEQGREAVRTTQVAAAVVEAESREVILC